MRLQHRNKSSSFWICLFVFLQILTLVSSGMVKFLKFYMDYTNESLMKNLFFSFSLDTILPATGYIRVKLPFQQSVTPTASWFEVNPATCNPVTIPVTPTPATITSINAVDNTYYVQFGTILNQNIPYTLIITFASVFSSTWLTLLPSITQRPIALDTFSAFDSSNPTQNLIIDTNPVFSMFWYHPSSSNTLSVSLVAGTSVTLSSTSTLTVRVVPTVAKIQTLKLTLPASATIYFDSSIPSTYCQVYYGGAYLILGVDFQCFNDQKAVMISFTSALVTAQNYDVQLTVNTPKYYETQTVTVYAMLLGVNKVLQYGTSATSIITALPNWTGWKLFGFQKKRFYSGNPSDIICIYRDQSATPMKVYNFLRFEFAVDSNVLTGQNYQLTLNLGTGTQVLTNSIKTINLADFSVTNTLSCSAFTNGSGVSCINVAPLVTGVTYTISARVNIPYASSSMSVFPVGFGALSLYPLLSTGLYSTSTAVATQTAATLTAQTSGFCLKNAEHFMLNNPTYLSMFDYQIAHSRASGINTDNFISASEGYGLKTSAAYQTLQFYFQIDQSQFNWAYSYYTTVEVLADNNVFTIPGTVQCSIQYGFSVNGYYIHCYEGVFDTQSYSPNPGVLPPLPTIPEQVVSFKQGMANGSQDDYFFGRTYHTYGAAVVNWHNIIISSPASAQPLLDFSTDFYLGTVITYNPPAAYSYFSTGLYNAYVLPYNVYSTFNVNLVNFWAGTGNANDGSKFPTFIRANLYFPSVPAYTVGNWIIFFDDLLYLADPSSSSIPSCSSTQVPAISCTYSAGDSTSMLFHFTNQIRFTSVITSAMVTQTASLTVNIPVQTVSGQTTIRMRVGLIDSSNLFVAISKFYTFQLPSLSANTDLVTFNRNNYLSVQGLSLRLKSSGYPAGTMNINTVATVAVADTTQLLLENTSAGAAQGAGVTFVSYHNFIQSASFSATEGLGTLIGTGAHQVCQTFSYVDGSATPLTRYGFHCPLMNNPGYSESTSYINLSQVWLPFEKGTRMPDIVAALSSNQASPVAGYNSVGFLMKYSIDSTLNAMNPNVLSAVSLNMDFPVILNINGLTMSPAGSYSIVIGGISITSLAKMRQDVYVETKSSEGKRIDLYPGILSIFYDFTPSNPTFILSNPTFLINNKLSFSILSFIFTVKNRAIYADEQILFDLDVFSVDSQTSNAVCKIFIPATASTPETFATEWGKCYFSTSTFQSLIIVPTKDIMTLDVSLNFLISYRVEIQGIRVPVTPVTEYFLTGYLYSSASSKEYYTLKSPTITLPTRGDDKTIIQTPQIVLRYKYVNSVGSLAQFVFSIKPTVQDLDVNSAIVIILPGYYSPQPIFADPYCTFQLSTASSATFLRCDYTSDRTIILRDISPTMTKNLAYTVVVSGIIQPLFTTASNIYIALSSSALSLNGSILESIEIADIVPTLPSQKYITISNFARTQSDWIVQDTYSINLIFSSTPATAVPSTSFLIVDFPSEWVDKAFDKVAVVCTLGVTSGVASAVTCIQQGFRLTVTLISSLTDSTEYTLTISKFSNPHYAQCIGQGIIVSIIDSTMTAVNWLSYHPLLNLDSQIFTQGTTSSMMFAWQSVVDDIPYDGTYTLSTISTSFQLFRGTYSRPLRLSVKNGDRLHQDFQLSLQTALNKQGAFFLSTSPLKFYLGDYYLEFRLGCALTTLPGTYSIYFVETNNGNYNIPPRLIVTVPSTPFQTLPSSQTLVQVSKFGYSLPIYWSMHSALPISDFKLETNIDISPDLELDYQASSDITFSLKTSSSYIQLRSEAEPISSLVSTTSLGVIIPSSNYFSIQQSSIAVSLAAYSSTPPILTATKTTTLPTSVSFTLSSTTLTLVYYKVQLSSSSLQFSLKDIKENVRLLTQYSFDDVDQVQYGMFPLYNIGVPFVYTISNLFTRRTYKVIFYPISNNEILGSTQEFTFTTAINGDFVLKTRFYTKAILTKTHLSYLACMLCNKFFYPINRVRTVLEISCDPSITVASLPAVTTSAQTQIYYFYLYPFEYVDQFERLGTYYDVAQMRAGVIAPFVTYFTSIFTGLSFPPLLDFQYGGVVLPYTPVWVSTGELSTTKNTFTLTDVELSKNGIIFCILEQLRINIKGRVVYIKNPTFDQVRLGLNSTGLNAIASQFAVYEGSPVIITFTGLLPSTHYRAVMYAMSEDPSIYKIVNNDFKTQEATLPAFGSHISSQIILILIMFYIIAY